MQSLVDNLLSGPCGVEPATAAIDRCAAEKSATLDLQQLRLTNHDIDALAPQLQRVSEHVTSLNLFLNDITDLSWAIVVLGNLRELLVGANPLSAVSADLLRGLPALEILDVGFSDTLDSLPDAFDATPRLRVLRAGNNRIAEVPPTLYTCASLEEIHLYGNCIKTLSADIGKLSHLRVLNVGRNQLTALPDTLAECHSLQCLQVYENCIASLPPGLGEIPSLTQLNVAGNVSLPSLPIDVRVAACAKTTAAFLSKA